MSAPLIRLCSWIKPATGDSAFLNKDYSFMRWCISLWNDNGCAEIVFSLNFLGLESCERSANVKTENLEEICEVHYDAVNHDTRVSTFITGKSRIQRFGGSWRYKGDVTRDYFQRRFSKQQCCTKIMGRQTRQFFVQHVAQRGCYAERFFWIDVTQHLLPRLQRSFTLHDQNK